MENVIDSSNREALMILQTYTQSEIKIRSHSLPLWSEMQQKKKKKRNSPQQSTLVKPGPEPRVSCSRNKSTLGNVTEHIAEIKPIANTINTGFTPICSLFCSVRPSRAEGRPECGENARNSCPGTVNFRVVQIYRWSDGVCMCVCQRMWRSAPGQAVRINNTMVKAAQ